MSSLQQTVNVSTNEGQEREFLNLLVQAQGVIGYYFRNTFGRVSFESSEAVDAFMSMRNNFKIQRQPGFVIKNPNKPPRDSSDIDLILSVLSFVNSDSSNFTKYLSENGAKRYLQLKDYTIVQFESPDKAKKVMNDREYTCNFTMSTLKRGKAVVYRGPETETSADIKIIFIDTESELGVFVDEITRHIETSSSPVEIGFDTEFDSYNFTDSFVLCLLQLHIGNATHGTTYLIDAYKLGDSLKILKPLLEHSNCRIIGFSLSCDLRLLATFDIVPLKKHTIDLQQLASYEGFRGGFNQLAYDELNVILSKDEQCKDWTVRPLGDPAKAYAANDVIYLSTIYDDMVKRLKLPETKFGEAILGWFEEELQWVESPKKEVPPPKSPKATELLNPIPTPPTIDDLVDEEHKKRRYAANEQRRCRVKLWFNILHSRIASKYTQGIAKCAASKKTVSELTRNSVPNLPSYRIELLLEAARGLPIDFEKFLTSSETDYYSLEREEYGGL